MFKSIGRARDKALESTVYGFLKGLAGEFINLNRDDVQFNLSEGKVQLTRVELKDKVKNIVNDALKEQGLEVYLEGGFLEHVELTKFFPTDVLDGDFDYPVSMKITGLVLIFQPTAWRTAEANKKLSKTERADKKKAEDKKKKQDAKDTKEAAKGKKDQPDTLVESFLQGFGHIEVTKIHIRYQDPRTKINIGMNIGMGKKHGGIKIYEPSTKPMSFRSVDKENKNVPKPKQDVVKQVFFPLPSIFINTHATEMIDVKYNFKLQPESTQVLNVGSLFTCSIKLDSRDLGENITVHNPKLDDPLKFALVREQIKVALRTAEEVCPKGTMTPDILIGADTVDNLGFTVTQQQLKHFWIDAEMEKAAEAEKVAKAENVKGSQTALAKYTDPKVGGFVVDPDANIVVDLAAIHTPQSFESLGQGTRST
jgi:hypothetical protein